MNKVIWVILFKILKKEGMKYFCGCYIIFTTNEGNVFWDSEAIWFCALVAIWYGGQGNILWFEDSKFKSIKILFIILLQKY